MPRTPTSPWSAATCGRCGVLVALAAWAALTAANLAEAANGHLAKARAEADAKFTAALNQLADKCDELGLSDQAEVTRNWIVPRAADRQYLFLVSETDLAKPPAAAMPVVHHWYRYFRQYRSTQANDLYELAEQEMEAGRTATAFRLAHEVLRENPDHERARSFLGYTRVNGSWRVPGAVERVRPGRLAHPKLGWAPGKYWRIETAHFEIVTNHSPDAGLKLGRKLEELFTVWQQLFVGYWADDALLKRRFAGATSVRSARRHYRVVLFRDRQEYVAQLSRAQPQIAMTLGYYLEREGTAFYYWGDVETEATWFHEGTHQLFQETRLGTQGVGETDNFWIVEAIALYMESLVRYEGYYTAGGMEAPRLQYARNRLLVGNFFVPLSELTVMGREALQTDPRIRQLYSQCSGMGHFLMDAGHGQYRQSCVDYLRAVYGGTKGADLLSKITELPLHRLDAEYRRFQDVTDEQLAMVPHRAKITKLALGRTSVTDQGILALPKLDKLEWLDLSMTRVSDAGAARLSEAENLQDLSLEGTRITDRTLTVLGQLTRLKELDLSQTAVTDAGLPKLKTLVYLTTLWLTGTKVTDGGLEHLAPLIRLEYLNVNETLATPDGYARLKQSLPSLKDS